MHCKCKYVLPAVIRTLKVAHCIVFNSAAVLCELQGLQEGMYACMWVRRTCTNLHMDLHSYRNKVCTKIMNPGGFLWVTVSHSYCYRIMQYGHTIPTSHTNTYTVPRSCIHKRIIYFKVTVTVTLSQPHTVNGYNLARPHGHTLIRRYKRYYDRARDLATPSSGKRIQLCTASRPHVLTVHTLFKSLLTYEKQGFTG